MYSDLPASINYLRYPETCWFKSWTLHEKNQLVLAPLIDSGLGPNLRTRYSMEAFLKGMTFPISCLSLSKKKHAI